MFVLYGLLALIAALLAVAVIRTLCIKAPARKESSFVATAEQLDTAAKKLGAMVRVPSVSKAEDEDLTQFYILHKELEKYFPLVHKHLEKTDLTGTLL